MIGRWFGKSEKRISAEEFGEVLATIAQACEENMEARRTSLVRKTPAGVTQECEASVEAGIPDGPEKLETEFSPLGISLIGASAVIWSSANNRFLQRLPAERFSTLRDTYYEKVWEGIVSHFGAEKAQYDEFVRRLGGLIIPDEFKSDWARRSGVHDILYMAVSQIGPAADEYLDLAARGSDTSAAGIALGKAVGRILFGRPTDEDVARTITAYIQFTAVTETTTKFLHELEGDGFLVV
jgi:hypothetical protein